MTWLLSHGKYKCVLSHPMGYVCCPIPWDMCAVPSHGMIPMGVHRSDIPMDKPDYIPSHSTVAL